jgi:hypothetical protein
VSTNDQWIGVEDVAAEMKYTARQAWEFIRSIGLTTVNARSMHLVRFTRGEFEEARDRAKAPIAPRHRVAPTGPSPEAKPPAKAKGKSEAAIAAKLARLRGT